MNAEGEVDGDASEEDDWPHAFRAGLYMGVWLVLKRYRWVRHSKYEIGQLGIHRE